MTIVDWITIGLLGSGGAFFFAGTMGLLRFPDVHSRLHALTKADNLGLGLVVAGLAIQADSATMAMKLLVVWILVLLGSGVSCFLIAREALPTGDLPIEARSRARHPR